MLIWTRLICFFRLAAESICLFRPRLMFLSDKIDVSFRHDCLGQVRLSLYNTHPSCPQQIDLVQWVSFEKDWCLFFQSPRTRPFYTLQHTAPHYNTLQQTATRCNTLQHAATHSNKLRNRFDSLFFFFKESMPCGQFCFWWAETIQKNINNRNERDQCVSSQIYI